ncbi:MAM and LDL-receptor class A domain-containing protein 1-like [Tubulanus polymorphus]|uniref:MAM and LDL-receptor class A domain-containing protein 1-like n=1 Tax=Tubulanus polymorphus TaxID=672921 RepID=UPI003DA3BB6A
MEGYLASLVVFMFGVPASDGIGKIAEERYDFENQVLPPNWSSMTSGEWRIIQAKNETPHVDHTTGTGDGYFLTHDTLNGTWAWHHLYTNWRDLGSSSAICVKFWFYLEYETSKYDHPYAKVRVSLRLYQNRKKISFHIDDFTFYWASCSAVKLEEAFSCEISTNSFKCRNGRCINPYEVCDRIDDCGDKTDEIKCPVFVPKFTTSKTPTTTPTIRRRGTTSRIPNDSAALSDEGPRLDVILPIAIGGGIIIIAVLAAFLSRRVFRVLTDVDGDDSSRRNSSSGAERTTINPAFDNNAPPSYREAVSGKYVLRY